MNILAQYKAEVLRTIAPCVEAFTNEHEATQQLWFPSEFSRGRAGIEWLPEELSAALVFNMLTEEGLPSFHRLLALYLGEAPHWRRWTDLWTAEEDRHGTVLRDVLMGVRSVEMVAVDKLQYAYLRNGFRPSWGNDPYKLIAYTVLQEKATQISHKNVAGKAASFDADMAKILGRIAREEGRHQVFYQNAFREVLARDPEDALSALADVMYSFEMPGASIPSFEDYAYLARRTGIFTTWDYLKIVEDTIEALGLSSIAHIRSHGERARERIMRFPRLLTRQAKVFGTQEARAVAFPFLPGWKGMV